jgi:hypothetical protein
MHVFNPGIALLEIIDVVERDENDENATSIHRKMVTRTPAVAINDA